MSTIEFENGEFCVDAAIVGETFDLDEAAVQASMRQGRLTSLCERGVDEDAGRYRLTFFYSNRQLRLIVDVSGTLLERSVQDVSKQVSARANRR